MRETSDQIASDAAAAEPRANLVRLVPEAADARATTAGLGRMRLFTPFIAQIAAIAAGAPQTRLRYRAPASEAASAYAAGKPALPVRRARFVRET